MWGAPRSRRRIASRRWPWSASVVLITAAVQLSACSFIEPNAPRGIRAPNEDASLPAKLAAALAERGRRLDSMQTPAVMEYTNPRHHLKVREQITIRRPQDLRIEAMSPFGVAMVLAARDSRLAIFRSSDNTLMRGAATADTLDRFAQVPLAPKPAVDLLMGLSPDDAILSAAPASVRVSDGLLVLSYVSSGGGTLELGFSQGQFAQDQLVMVRQRLAGGRVSYAVHYSDFQDIGGIMMAYQIEADFPLAQSTVKFSLQRPIVNGAVADSMFVLSPGPSTREIDLDQPTLSSSAP
jgi:hypothetical protein